MLRIDETSKTLVAPPAGGLVTEVNPDREEMLALVSSSWEAFAGELGQPSLRFVGQGQVPGLDLLAFDEQAGRAVVVGVSADVDGAAGLLVEREQVEAWDLALAHEAKARLAELACEGLPGGADEREHLPAVGVHFGDKTARGRCHQRLGRLVDAQHWSFL